MWINVEVYGSRFYLYIQKGEVKQIRAGNRHMRATTAEREFPNLYREIIARIPREVKELQVAQAQKAGV